MKIQKYRRAKKIIQKRKKKEAILPDTISGYRS
ncbi:MAG: hypothetical protein ACJASR_002553 [Psychroserpens sp.]|jgi:hypothetical protein